MTTNVRELSERVETLLESLEPHDRAEELVRTLVTLYGEGLSRILQALDGSPDRQQVVDALCADEFVASLLIIHDLHPVPLEVRIERALDGVRPYLRSHGGEVDLTGVDSEGTVELRLRGTCDGCPSSSVTLKLAVEEAIRKAAPEILEVRANTVAEEPLPVVSTWRTLEDISELSPFTLTHTMVDGTPLLVLRGEEEYYAYRDRCPACLRELQEPVLSWPFVTCSACSESFDAVLAGKSTNGGGHLEPLPLSHDVRGIRIAVPAGA